MIMNNSAVLPAPSAKGRKGKRKMNPPFTIAQRGNGCPNSKRMPIFKAFLSAYPLSIAWTTGQRITRAWTPSPDGGEGISWRAGSCSRSRETSDRQEFASAEVSRLQLLGAGFVRVLKAGSTFHSDQRPQGGRPLSNMAGRVVFMRILREKPSKPSPPTPLFLVAGWRGGGEGP
jgi:hypothetical protein